MGKIIKYISGTLWASSVTHPRGAQLQEQPLQRHPKLFKSKSSERWLIYSLLSAAELQPLNNDGSGLISFWLRNYLGNVMKTLQYGTQPAQLPGLSEPTWNTQTRYLGRKNPLSSKPPHVKSLILVTIHKSEWGFFLAKYSKQWFCIWALQSFSKWVDFYIISREKTRATMCSLENKLKARKHRNFSVIFVDCFLILWDFALKGVSYLFIFSL